MSFQNIIDSFGLNSILFLLKDVVFFFNYLSYESKDGTGDLPEFLGSNLDYEERIFCTKFRAFLRKLIISDIKKNFVFALENLRRK